MYIFSVLNNLFLFSSLLIQNFSVHLFNNSFFFQFHFNVALLYPILSYTRLVWNSNRKPFSHKPTNPNLHRIWPLPTPTVVELFVLLLHHKILAVYGIILLFIMFCIVWSRAHRAYHGHRARQKTCATTHHCLAAERHNDSDSWILNIRGPNIRGLCFGQCPSAHFDWHWVHYLLAPWWSAEAALRKHRQRKPALTSSTVIGSRLRLEANRTAQVWLGVSELTHEIFIGQIEVNCILVLDFLQICGAEVNSVAGVLHGSFREVQLPNCPREGRLGPDKVSRANHAGSHAALWQCHSR